MERVHSGDELAKVPAFEAVWDEAALAASARRLAACLELPAYVSLRGPIGAGKTTFVRFLAEALGWEASDVRSPSFSLVNTYEGSKTLIHVDLYRLASARDVALLDLDDVFEGSTLLCVEWPEVGAGVLPPWDLDFEFSPGSAEGLRGVRGQAGTWLGARALEALRSGEGAAHFRRASRSASSESG